MTKMFASIAVKTVMLLVLLMLPGQPISADDEAGVKQSCYNTQNGCNMNRSCSGVNNSTWGCNAYCYDGVIHEDCLCEHQVGEADCKDGELE